MSYNLAIWDGPIPRSHESGRADYQRRVGAIEGAPVPPTPKIAALAAALTNRFPDLDSLDDDEIDSTDTPWATGPLLAEAKGGFLYLPMTTSGAEAHLQEVVEIVLEHGLVCFDPQGGNVYNLEPKQSGRSKRSRWPSTRSPLVRAPLIFLVVAMLMVVLDKCT